MRYLLDTNTCIAAMQNHPKVVLRMAAASPIDCAISTIVIFELYTGVEKSAHPIKERTKVETLVQNYPDLPFDTAAAMEAAWVRAILDRQGRPIGPYDTLLAGQAIARSLIVVTANVREFSRVPGLLIEDWQ